jgi:hypothetical protein
MVFIDNYTKKCKTTLGGIKKLYLFPFVKYSRAQIKVSGMNLTEFPDTFIYEFDAIGSYSQNSEVENGDVFYNQSCTINLSEVYDVLNIQDLLVQDYRAIFLTNNNQYLISGTRNGLTGTTNNTSGTTKSEFNGFTLDFTGKEENPLLLIDDLESLGFFTFNKEEVFNYDFNFDI